MRHLILTLITALGLCHTASAFTISWGGAVGDFLYTSNGSTLDSTFTFELGTFGTFIPTENNKDDWAANWKLFDRAVDGTGWFPEFPYLASSANLNTDGTSSSTFASPTTTFTTGERAYIWTYNSLALTETSEWALISGTNTGTTSNTAWFLPSPSEHSGNTVDWRFDTASTISLGGLNDTRGPGTFTNDPGTYNLQTSVVPEPSSALLALASGFLLNFRRKRR